MFNITVARAERDAVRSVSVFVVRTTLFWVAVRATFVGWAARVVAVRWGARVVDDVAVRATVCFAVVRAVIFFWLLSVRFGVLRDTEFASRTAASATLTPRISAVMRYVTFLIRYYCKYILSKNVWLCQ